MLRLHIDKEDGLACDMHIQNRGDRDKRVTRITGLVNGTPLVCGFPQNSSKQIVFRVETQRDFTVDLSWEQKSNERDR